MKGVIVGKRIPIGAAVGALFTFAAWFWNTANPDKVLPAHIVQAGTTAAVFAVQLAVVNFLGVTTGE